jgi:hypothetical protein
MLYGDDTIKEQVNTRGWSRPRGLFVPALLITIFMLHIYSIGLQNIVADLFISKLAGDNILKNRRGKFIFMKGRALYLDAL